MSQYEESESLEHSNMSGEHDKPRFSDLDMMPGNTQQTHAQHLREDDKLFAIVENEEDKEEDDDELIPRSPTQQVARNVSHQNSPNVGRKIRLETPGNEESKRSFDGPNPFRVKPVRGHSEIELRHMSTI
jgi:hypothetical protein